MRREKSGLEQYLSQVKRSLHGSPWEKRKILGQVRASLADVPNIEILSLSELLTVADPPRQAALEFQQEAAPDGAGRKLRSFRRVTACLTAVMVVVSIALVWVSDRSSEHITTAVEYRSNGDTIVTEFRETGRSFSRDAGIRNPSGKIEKTYYLADGTKVWSLSFYGEFRCENGIPSQAIMSTAVLHRYLPGVSLVYQDDDVDRTLAYSAASIRYAGETLNVYVRLQCDPEGQIFA